MASSVLQEGDLAALAPLTWLQHLDLGGFATISDTIIEVTMTSLRVISCMLLPTITSETSTIRGDGRCKLQSQSMSATSPRVPHKLLPEPVPHGRQVNHVTVLPPERRKDAALARALQGALITVPLL